MSNPTDDQQLPERPSVRQGKLEALVWELAHVFVGHEGHMDVSMARHLGRSCAAVIGHRVPENNVQNTLTQYAGERLNDKLIERLSWQLAARVADLRAGPLLRAAVPVGVGWHMLEIYGLVHDEKRGKTGYATTLFCRYGQLAGYRLEQWFSERYLAFLSYEVLGFGRRLEYDADEPTHLLGLRAWTYMSEREGQLNLGNWDNDSSSRRRNQGMLKRRLRFSVDVDRLKEERAHEYSCTRNFDHYCADCPIRPDQCEASIHRDPLAAEPAVHNEPGGGRTG